MAASILDKTLPPFHILAYGTVLGLQVHQTFIAGLVAYKTLPRPYFSALQKGLFPIYFALQTALPVAIALSFPGELGLNGQRIGTSLAGVLEPANRYNTLLPLLVMFVGSAVNMLIVGPKVTQIMVERKHQGTLSFIDQPNRPETRDGKKSYDPAPHSPEMKKLNSAFGKMHGISSLLNMGSFLATCYYGVILGNMLK